MKEITKEKIVTIKIGRMPIDELSVFEITNFQENNWYWEIRYAIFDTGKEFITEITRHSDYKTYKDAMIGVLLELENDQLK